MKGILFQHLLLSFFTLYILLFGVLPRDYAGFILFVEGLFERMGFGLCAMPLVYLLLSSYYLQDFLKKSQTWSHHHEEICWGFSPITIFWCFSYQSEKNLLLWKNYWSLKAAMYYADKGFIEVFSLWCLAVGFLTIWN